MGKQLPARLIAWRSRKSEAQSWKDQNVRGAKEKTADFCAPLQTALFVYVRIVQLVRADGFPLEPDCVESRRFSLTNGDLSSECEGNNVRFTNAILGALVAHWDNLRDNIGRVNSSIQFQPSEGYSLFQPDHERSTGEVALFRVGPVVFNLPERGDHLNANLFVVADCTLGFDVESYKTDKRLVSSGYATHVGYFRRGTSQLEHVYGVHYDFDTERPAHPVFHAQLKSFAAEFEPHVREQFSISMEVDDRVKDMLQNVRLPSAQLDFFSLVVQLAADHLMWRDSGQVERDAFNDILKLDASIVGATRVSEALRVGAAIPCHRAAHWYAKLQDPVAA